MNDLVRATTGKWDSPRIIELLTAHPFLACSYSKWVEQGRRFDTLFEVAVTNLDLAVCAFMLNGGFTFDTENAQNILLYPTYGRSPRHEETMAMVALLLKHGANPFVKRDGYVSPMQDAMGEGDVKAVTLFVNWAYDTDETRILFRYMREAYSAFPPGRHTPRNIRMHLLLMSLVPGTPAFYRHLLNFRRPHGYNRTYELLSKCMRIVFGTLELIMARESGQLVLPMELVRVVHFKLMPRI